MFSILCGNIVHNKYLQQLRALLAEISILSPFPNIKIPQFIRIEIWQNRRFASNPEDLLFWFFSASQPDRKLLFLQTFYFGSRRVSSPVYSVQITRTHLFAALARGLHAVEFTWIVVVYSATCAYLPYIAQDRATPKDWGMLAIGRLFVRIRCWSIESGVTLREVGALTSGAKSPMRRISWEGVAPQEKDSRFELSGHVLASFSGDSAHFTENVPETSRELRQPSTLVTLHVIGPCSSATRTKETKQ